MVRHWISESPVKFRQKTAAVRKSHAHAIEKKNSRASSAEVAGVDAPKKIEVVISQARSQFVGLTHLKMGEGVEASQTLTTQIYPPSPSLKWGKG